MIKYRKLDKKATTFLTGIKEVPRDVQVYLHEILKVYELWWRKKRVMELGKRFPFPSSTQNRVRYHFLKRRRGDYKDVLMNIEKEEREQKEKTKEFVYDVNISAGKEFVRMNKKLRGLEGTASMVVSRPD